MLEIDWEPIPDKYIFATADDTGLVFAFTLKPVYWQEPGIWLLGDGEGKGEYICVEGAKHLYGSPSQTLTHRPLNARLRNLTDQELLDLPNSEKLISEMVRPLFQHYVNSTTPIKF